MIKGVHQHVWAFDAEWAPDPMAGRVLYRLPEEMSDVEVVGEMWRRGGATEEDPTPFLKTVLCRVVSIAAVQRRVRGGDVDLNLLWLPRQVDDPAQLPEEAVVGKFLDALGKHRPQLVGFNSQGSDLKILVQRAVVKGIAAPDFCKRPDKPWEGTDYFTRGHDMNIDLMDLLGGFGKSTSVSLHEIASLSGIPGKFAAEGEQVAQMWMTGRWNEIVQYNCFDALTTYLVWLRVAHFAGHFSREAYEEEQERLRDLIMGLSEKPETAYLEQYLEEWDRLQAATGQV